MDILVTYNDATKTFQVTIWKCDLRGQFNIDINSDDNLRMDFTDTSLTGALLQATYWVHSMERK